MWYQRYFNEDSPKLHISDGGLSIFYAEDKVIPAYVSSYTAALPDLKEAFPEIENIIQDKIQMSTECFDAKYTNSPIPDNLQRYFTGIDE